MAEVPSNAVQVCYLLKQGSLPVSAAIAAVLQSLRARQNIVTSNSRLAQLFGVKLTNIASYNVTGKATRANFAVLHCTFHRESILSCLFAGKNEEVCVHYHAPVVRRVGSIAAFRSHG